jgi:L-rhamnose mutarotase
MEPTLIRKQFVMQLKSADCIAAYKKVHDEIWPEMVDVLKSHGVHSYSIALQEQTLQLFAYAEVGRWQRSKRVVLPQLAHRPANLPPRWPQIEDEARWAEIGSTEVCQRWWAANAALMVVDGIRPVATELKEMFFLQ